MPKNIEVEVRSLITPMEYRRLKAFLKRHGKPLGSHRDQNTYFDRDGKLRIAVEPYGAFLKYKGGKIHAQAREEILVPISRKDITKLERLLQHLGFRVVVRWSRQREKFLWRGATITLDQTRGYGRMIDIEKMATPRTTGKTHQKLRGLAAELGLRPTPSRELSRRYRWYLRNWRQFYR